MSQKQGKGYKLLEYQEKMKKYFIVITGLLVITLAFIFSGCGGILVSQASNETNSEVLPLTPAEMKELMDEGKEYILIDVRSKEEYNLGHISGAKLIPVSDMESRLDELSKDKKIIVYCKSGKRSKTAAEILNNNGFKNIYDMGGIEDWINEGYPIVIEKVASVIDGNKEFEEISVDEAYQIFKSGKDYLFVDVRSEGEYKNYHVEGAIHIPAAEIEKRFDEIPQDKIIIVYCNGSSCNRSGMAASILVENGYTTVYNMVGQGIIEWLEKGYPVNYEK